MRQCSNCSISSGISGAAKRVPDVPELTPVNTLEVNRGGLVLGNSYALNNVSFVSVPRQGPPSWIIRCVETNDIFISQASAALKMELPQSEISKHLNGVMDHVRGYHFERIAMAAR